MLHLSFTDHLDNRLNPTKPEVEGGGTVAGGRSHGAFSLVINSFFENNSSSSTSATHQGSTKPSKPTSLATKECYFTEFTEIPNKLLLSGRSFASDREKWAEQQRQQSHAFTWS